MRRLLVLLLAHLGTKLGRGLQALLQTIAEDSMADNGPKESAALADLDAALDSLQEWKDAEDESDASQINERVERLNAMFRPGPGQPTDALTGQPVPATGGEVGPTAPDTTGATAPGPTETTEGGAAPVDPSERTSSN